MIPASKVKVLVVGSGGREHALAWKLAKSPLVGRVYCAPGNGGTAAEEGVENVDISVGDFQKLADFSSREGIDLVVIGPDNPLAGGIVDILEDAGLRVFGPRKEAAKLEWSKAYAKDFMTARNIPTAAYCVADSLREAEDFVSNNDWARVVKMDGLAFGKGVFVNDSEESTLAALRHIFSQDPRATVVIEERLEGKELSLLVLSDGKRLLPLLPSQDYKRRFAQDNGPNTGGMGAYAPVDLYSRARQEIESHVLAPLSAAFARGQLDYKGLLYIGLMISETNAASSESGSGLLPYVLEFNCRFGDPETQAILPLLESDLLPALWACTEGGLEQMELTWLPAFSCCVVAVDSGYPGSSSNGQPVEIGSLPGNTHCFQAGTRLEGRQLLTNGGRILNITGIGASIEEARQRAYLGLKNINFPGLDYRPDIGERSLSQCQ